MVVDESYKKAEQLYYKGANLSKEGKLEEAKKCLEESLKLNPDASVVWNELGVVYSKSNDFEKALEAYNKGIEICPKDETKSEILFNKGIMLFNSERYADAEKTIETALKLCPNDNDLVELLNKMVVNNPLRRASYDELVREERRRHANEIRTLRQLPFNVWVD